MVRQWTRTFCINNNARMSRLSTGLRNARSDMCKDANWKHENQKPDMKLQFVLWCSKSVMWCARHEFFSYKSKLNSRSPVLCKTFWDLFSIMDCGSFDGKTHRGCALQQQNLAGKRWSTSPYYRLPWILRELYDDHRRQTEKTKTNMDVIAKWFEARLDVILGGWEWKSAALKSQYNAKTESAGLIRDCTKLPSECNFLMNCWRRENGTHEDDHWTHVAGSGVGWVVWREENESA